MFAYNYHTWILMGHTTKRLVLLGFPDSKPLSKKTPLGDDIIRALGALEVALLSLKRKHAQQRGSLFSIPQLNVCSNLFLETKKHTSTQDLHYTIYTCVNSMVWSTKTPENTASDQTNSKYKTQQTFPSSQGSSPPTIDLLQLPLPPPENNDGRHS